MAINFPSSPSNGTTHTEAGVTWVYDGTSWKSTGYTASSGALGSLTDVTLSSVQTGQLLSYSGSSWGNASLSLNGLSDVDLATTPPTDGQTLIWDNTAGVWEPGTITGGVGSEVDTLDSVTTRGDTTTNDINVGGVLAGGLKLNVNHTGSPTATVGDIKRINEHPHYYDGTTWRPFYLSGTSLSATTSDVHFDDVQVRMDFESGTAPLNYANQRDAEIYVISPNSIGGVEQVTSPTKFGTKCMKLWTQGGSARGEGLRWFAVSNSVYTSNWSGTYAKDSYPEYWSNAKRGGALDWSQDWTLEFWVRFADIDTSVVNQRGIFHVYDSTDTSAGGFGLVLETDGASRWYLKWLNWYTDNVQTSLQLEVSSNTNYNQDQWYFISLTYDASTGALLLHRDGTNVTLTGNSAPVDNNIPAANTTGFVTHFGSFASSNTYNAAYLNNFYIDDLRITQFARYDSNNYSPPTAAFPITVDAPPTVDPDWSNVVVRSTFDTNSDNIASGGGAPTQQHSNSQILSTGQKYGTGALRHDSGPAYLTYYTTNSPLDPSGTWTIEFWLKLEGFTSGGAINQVYRTIWAQGDGSSSDDYAFGLRWSTNNYTYLGTGGNAFTFFWRNDTTISNLNYDSVPQRILEDGYHHVAVVRNSTGDIVVYFDGYKLRHNIDDTTVFNDTGITYNSASSMRIGDPEDDISSYDNSFDGYIDDLRITTTVKYTENFTPPSGPLPTTGTITNNPPGTPTSGYLTYPTTNGTSGQALTSDGTGNVVWSDNPTTLVGLTDTDLTTVAPQTGDFLAYDGTNWIGASTSLTGLADVDLFSVAPTNGQALLYNASTLLWEPGTVSGGGGGSSLQSRTTAQGQTSSALSTGGAGDINITAAKTFALLKVETSHAAWVTIYTDDTSRTNDSSRTEIQDPAPGSGVLAEVITTGAATQIITPGTFCWNNDSTPSTTTYLKVVNKDPAAQQITVTLTYVQLES